MVGGVGGRVTVVVEVGMGLDCAVVTPGAPPAGGFTGKVACIGAGAAVGSPGFTELVTTVGFAGDAAGFVGLVKGDFVTCGV